MPRSPRSLFVALPLVLAATLGGCGSGEATQGSVRDQVEGALRDAADNTEFGDIPSDARGEIADCVSRAMFESEELSKDDRNDITSASDGDAPPADLVAAVHDLVQGCIDDATGEE